MNDLQGHSKLLLSGHVKEFRILHPVSVCLSLSLCVCVCVCLSANIYLEPLDRSSRNLLRLSAVAVSRSSYGGVALRYVLLVLWMTLYGRRRCVAIGVAIPGRSLISDRL